MYNQLFAVYLKLTQYVNQPYFTKGIQCSGF